MIGNPTRTVRLLLITVLTGSALLWGSIASAGDDATTPANDDSPCAETAALLREQNTRLTRDLRRIQRELAFLREAMTRPGMQEIIGGIGYIFGICGIVFYMSARKNARHIRED